MNIKYDIALQAFFQIQSKILDVIKLNQSYEIILGEESVGGVLHVDDVHAYNRLQNFLQNEANREELVMHKYCTLQVYFKLIA